MVGSHAVVRVARSHRALAETDGSPATAAEGGGRGGGERKGERLDHHAAPGEQEESGVKWFAPLGLGAEKKNRPFNITLSSEASTHNDAHTTHTRLPSRILQRSAYSHDCRER